MMTHFPDIPRAYTALAETLACLLVCYPLSEASRLKLLGKWVIPLIFLGQVILQLLAGTFPLTFWVLGMLINIAWMYASISFLGVSKPLTQIYLTAKAFVAAELIASISWHIYCLTLLKTSYDSLASQMALVLALYCLVLYLLYRQEKKTTLADLDKFIDKRDVAVAVFTSVAIFSFSNIGFILSGTRQFQDSTSIFILRTTANLSGMLLLFTQESQQYDRYLREELSSINRMFELQYKQYQAYRENSELISRKVHDLKHQLYIIRQEADKQKQNQYLDEMTIAIQNFETKVETGNPILDTILTQKNHYCLQNKINFTCIVQGEPLNFMDAMDISALFGNAMDNAIEAVEKIPQEEKRLITLKVSSHNNFIVMRLDNYDTSNIELSSHTLPSTSKKNKDYHGIGLKSMDYITQKYNGQLTLTKEDNWVRLKILIPQA
ncbi:GHKL domain-containing protein [Streptococcus cameli]